MSGRACCLSGKSSTNANVCICTCMYSVTSIIRHSVEGKQGLRLQRLLITMNPR